MSLSLIIEDDRCFRECIDCGEEIPDPYLEDDEDEEGVLCSTCDAERGFRRRLRRLTRQHTKPAGLGEAICVCGKRLPDCTVATCLEPDSRPKYHAKLKKREERQRRLFD